MFEPSYSARVNNVRILYDKSCILRVLIAPMGSTYVLHCKSPSFMIKLLSCDLSISIYITNNTTWQVTICIRHMHFPCIRHMHFPYVRLIALNLYTMSRYMLNYEILYS